MRRITLALPLLVSILSFGPPAVGTPESPQNGRPPNVLFIITDDQGYGDLGCHGNPKIQTPYIDGLAKESFQFDRFCVYPVCSPTRSALMTGRYPYRTGIVDTFMGRSMMHAGEITLAERLGVAGYKTGIFGKWHLGDNYPLRAQDQGFQESLTIRGGGIGQPSDPPGGDKYQDATMYRNGKAEKTSGYCTDVFTDAAIEFMAAHKERPFFAYVPFNAPHTPLEIPDGYVRTYRDAGVPYGTSSVYAMVSNIDYNVGRLLSKLDELRITRDTIVVFMTDNGPEKERYNAGMRGLKGTVYEGGIRVPFFFRWPLLKDEPKKISGLATVLDIAPTILDAARIADHFKVPMDGVSLLPSFSTGKAPANRTYMVQWHRGDVPEPFQSCAAMDDRWKLVWTKPKAKPELFDFTKEEPEKTDVSEQNPSEVERLTKAYKDWFEDVKKTRGFEPPRIVLGADQEPLTVLTRQDLRNPKPGGTGPAHWLVELPAARSFDVTVRFKPSAAPGTLTYTCGETKREVQVPANAPSVLLKEVALAAGKFELSATLVAEKPVVVDYVELQRLP